jgi:hypothetical protein
LDWHPWTGGTPPARSGRSGRRKWSPTTSGSEFTRTGLWMSGKRWLNGGK